MNRLTIFISLVILACAALATEIEGEPVDVAKFDNDGQLIVPLDIDQWVFLGSSLGMGYSQSNFDPDSPGMFQIVRMEPTAYQAFLDTGRFVDGTMFSLHFYGSENEISINRSGFVMGELQFAEIHLKDSDRFPDGFNFYNINNGQKVSAAISLPNECVECHKRDGAYDGVFTQFYPVIRDRVPSASIATSGSSTGEHAAH